MNTGRSERQITDAQPLRTGFKVAVDCLVTRR